MVLLGSAWFCLDLSGFVWICLGPVLLKLKRLVGWVLMFIRFTTFNVIRRLALYCCHHIHPLRSTCQTQKLLAYEINIPLLYPTTIHKQTSQNKAEQERQNKKDITGKKICTEGPSRQIIHVEDYSYLFLILKVPGYVFDGV